MSGQIRSANDPEPSAGTLVRDACGTRWIKTEGTSCSWVRADLDVGDPESWVKVAGNYGPVIVESDGQA